MKRTATEPINLKQNPLTRQLLTGLLVVALLLLISTITRMFNLRINTECDYNSATGTITISQELIDQDYFFNGSEWIFVPNVGYNAIYNGAFVYDSYIGYPYADHVSISASSGWNNLGSNATWHNTDKMPKLRTFKEGTQSYSNALYLCRIKLPSGVSSLNISAPDINGSAVLFCNNKYIGDIGYDNHDSFIDVSGGFEEFTLVADENNELEIIIAVKSNTTLYSPGIASYPQFAKSNIESKATIISIVWLVVQLVTLVFTLIGGIIVSRTFKDKRNYYIFIGIQFCLLFYNLIDCNYIILDSLAKLIIKYVFEMLAAVHVYTLISVLFKDCKRIANKIFLKYDRYIISMIAIFLMVLLFINKTLFSTNFPIISLFLFTSALCLITIMNILFFYIDMRYSSIALSIAITAYFSFINMQQEEMILFNIPTYSIYSLVSVFALDLMFIFKYYKHYKELEDLSRHLQAIVTEKTLHISEINRDLIATNKRLLENEEARKNVLSNVSHDLRTPITAIRGYAELMNAMGDKMTSEQRSTYIDNIIKRSTQMENIVSDIVELTKMESGTSEFVFTDLSLCDLLEEQKNLFASEITKNGKTLDLDLPKDDLLIVRVDEKRFNRVIQNLISNAINYTGENGVINVKAWRTTDNQGVSNQTINIDISDNGIGIPEDAIPNIFDRFYRASNSGKNIKGTGLGLSIVKTIIDHHNATISVSSKLNEGTTFHITIPAV